MEGALHVAAFSHHKKHNEHLFFTWSSNDTDECLVMQRSYPSRLAAIESRDSSVTVTVRTFISTGAELGRCKGKAPAPFSPFPSPFPATKQLFVLVLSTSN